MTEEENKLPVFTEEELQKAIALFNEDDIYDVKGVKAKSEDFEGSYVGFVHTVPFFAHIKALPPIE